MIPLGILAAAGIAPLAAGSFDLLETQVLATSAASVTFSGLSAYAADYKHLQIRMTARSTLSTSNNTFVRFNGNTGSNYSSHTLVGNGSSVTSVGYANEAQIFFDGGMPGSNSAANIFAGSVLDILDPFVSTKFTTTRAINGFTGANNFINLNSGVFRIVDAISSITLAQGSATNFVTGSRFSIYGLKGA